MMRILVLTTRCPDELRTGDCNSVTCGKVLETIASSGKTTESLYGRDELEVFKRKLSDDSVMYVMPCIDNDQVGILCLKERQDIIGALVQDVLNDTPGSGTKEIAVVAHDKDLFNLEIASERSFDIETDLVRGSILDVVLKKFSDTTFTIYGYQHELDYDERVYSVIYLMGIDGLDQDDDIIQLICDKIKQNEAP